MHFVTLVVQAHKSTTHGYDIVIRMRRKNKASFRIWRHSLRCIRKRLIFSARPSCNAVPEHIEYFQVDFVCIALHSEEVTQSMVVIILICETQNRLTKFECCLYYSIA